MNTALPPAQRRTTSASKRARRSKPATRAPKDFEELELVHGALIINERFKVLRQSAKRTLLEIVSSLPSDKGSDDIDIDPAPPRKGATCRRIQDRAAFETPGQLERVAKQAEAGNSIRILAATPMSLAIADEKRAIVIGRGSLAGGAMPQAVIVNEGTVLNVLIETFEALWNRSTAFRTLALADGSSEINVLKDLDRRILTAMGAGLTDNEIALQLSVGHRTVQRRARQMSDILGVDTRFQAGVEATKRGWFA